MRQKRAALKAAGIDVDLHERRITGLLADATAEDARGDFLIAESRKSTARSNAAYGKLYEACSGLIDAFAGVLGKGSEDAAALRRMRSRIRMPGDQSDADGAAVEPALGSPR